jgi:hypothetical protein
MEKVRIRGPEKMVKSSRRKGKRTENVQIRTVN